MITVAVLNYKRPIEWLEGIISSSLKQSVCQITPNVIICSDESEETLKKSDVLKDLDFTYIENTGESIANSKNKIIEKSIELDTEKLILIEDDTVISDEFDDTFEKYIDLMNDMNLGVIFNCYTKPANYVLTKPSPRLLLGYKGHAKSEMLTTNRHEMCDFMIIDVVKNKERFNEDLCIFESSEYIFKSQKSGQIPFLNQFFDIPDSWEKISGREIDTSRNCENHVVNEDRQKMDKVVNGEWSVNNDLNDIIEYIRKQLGV
tara:strand:+ start:18513 stop:19295 length:783 start_codon:yes stop_codon:yes gene_type:complete